MTPRPIAAVIVCHDLGRWVLEALDSVERQTRPAAEIVVVDDASTDIYTQQVLAQLERQGTRVVRAGGHGASAARNLGVKLTSAEYVVWLDGDDRLEPHYFEVAGARLDADAALDFVSCAMRAFGAADYVWIPAEPTFVDAVATGGVPHASTMIRRRLWEEVGGFDQTLRTFELLDFWASAIDRGFRGIVLDEPLLNYRVRAGSGYRRSIQTDTYLARLKHFYAKHREAVERNGPELVVAKEAFLEGQRHYRRTLESRAVSLEAELATLGTEIAAMVALLESQGESRVAPADFRRVHPLSHRWGRDRGTPIDRHYIEAFLEKHRRDVRGRVLEIREPLYAPRFGGDAVTALDVLDLDATNPAATIVADLRHADAIGTATYDCIILTQTLQLIDDIPSALAECVRMLRPGGVLLVTVPSVIRVDDEAGVDRDFWRLTEASARKLFADAFPIDAFDVAPYGNVMACTAFLYGMSVEEVAVPDLDHRDPAFPLVIAVRAVKPLAVSSLGPPVRAHHAVAVPAILTPAAERPAAAILAYHRVADLSPDSHALCTPAGEFREHMAYLARNFTVMGLEDLVAAAAAGRIPDGAVAVTLDDGYVDALTAASDILTEFGVPATFFINSDRLHEEHERWWDVLEHIFLGDQKLPPALALQPGGLDLRVPTVSARERRDALDALSGLAWPLDASARADLVDSVVTWSGAVAPARSTHRVLTGDEVRTLASRWGHSIGAHTTHHLALTRHGLETTRREVFENKAALEQLLEEPVHLFAYPYGELNSEVLTVVREAGFHAAVTVHAGLVASGCNRLLLPRHEITTADHGRFPLRMREIFDRRQPWA